MENKDKSPTIYCYYSTQRLISIGTYPNKADNLPEQIINYDKRRQIKGTNIQAWGELHYLKPLTEQQLYDFKLKAVPSKLKGEPEYQYLYPYSYLEATRLGEDDMGLYIKSLQANIECSKEIANCLKNYCNDNFLLDANVKKIIERFGYDRVHFVLANTIQHMGQCDEFPEELRLWTNLIHLPPDIVNKIDRRKDLVINSEFSLISLFAEQVKKLYDALGLYTIFHCNSIDELDFKKKVMVLNPIHLDDKFKKPEFQLIYCTYGFGCSPTANDRKVFGKFLRDGEKCCFLRNDFLGELRPEFMPEWASKKLEKIK